MSAKGTRLTPFSRNRIRQLCRAGWTTAEIGYEVGHSASTVLTVLRDANLVPVESPKNPILGYSSLPEDAEALTPLRAAELAASAARAFEVRVEYDMTVESAPRDLAMSTRDLAARDGLTLEQARVVQAKAYEFLARLNMAKKENGDVE